LYHYKEKRYSWTILPRAEARALKFRHATVA
jgi:hypothetical protein